MGGGKVLRFYLEPKLHKAVLAGRQNFVTRVATVVQGSGFDVSYLGHPDISDAALSGDDLSITDARTPVGKNGLVLGLRHHAPFWFIDHAAERWDRDVAHAVFDPQTISKNEAIRFYHYWRERLFGDAPMRTSQEGFVYVPLQNDLTTSRPSGTCTQLEMIAACLKQEPHRPIVAALNPKETYSDAELTALNQMDAANDRLTVRIGAMKEMLRTCDYVVTQNSAVAFNAYFFAKPSILFAKADFHHIALNVADGEAMAFRKVMKHKPEWARYVWWFWQKHAINQGRNDVEAKIAARLRRFGWPIK